MHDVVIVGAGPGGSSAAHFLSRGGLDVLLLDRADFPRDKTCGDGLTPRALRTLDSMGVLPEVVAAGCAVDTYEVVAPSGGATAAPITAAHGALVIRRAVLDNMLVQHVIRGGVRFEPRVTATHVEPSPSGVRVHAATGRTFEARMAIIATGAATGVLKGSGILRHRPRAMLAARAYFDEIRWDVASSFHMRFQSVPLPGYGWVFPVGKTTANVGVGYLQRRRVPTANVVFERFTWHKPIRALLAGSRQVGPVKGYPIRLDFLKSTTVAERTLLVGEAAGLVNPLTGEGIDYALESGKIAADHLLDLFREGNFSLNRVADYHRLLLARFEKTFRFSEWVRDWYGRGPLLDLFIPLANRHPELRQMLANIVLGEREPRGYGPAEMLARLIWYLIRHP